MIRRKGVGYMNLIEYIDNHTWIANIIGIFISAGVAIWIMDKNHKDSERKIIDKEIREDNVKMSSATIYMGQILTLSMTIYNAYDRSNIQRFNRRDIEIIENYLEEIESYSKEIMSMSLHHDNDEFKRLIHHATNILNAVRDYKGNHILHYTKKSSVFDASSFYRVFKDIHNNSYEYLLKREDYQMAEGINKLS